MDFNRPKRLVLEAVGRFQYLSNTQLTRYVYGSSVLKYVQDATSKLVKEQYLRKLYLPTLSPHGRPRAFYCLSDTGYKCLGDPSLPLPPKFKDKQDRYRHGIFLLHFEASNDLMILACDWPRRDPRITISRFLTEAQIKKRRFPLRPDGWVEFQGVEPATVMFELDRGTEAFEDWEKKIKNYSSYVSGQYQQDYGVTHYPTIAVMVPAVPMSPAMPTVMVPNRRRLTTLLTWTKAILMRIGDYELGDQLYFASFDPVKTSSPQAFLAPIWVSLNGSHHQPLLPDDILSPP